MKNNIVNCYSEGILKPIEEFIKSKENDMYRNKHKNLSDVVEKKVLEEANELFLQKLEKFCLIVEEEWKK